MVGLVAAAQVTNIGLCDETVAALQARNITSLFPIQKHVFEPARAGRDLIGRARTGSGKTLAFALPVIENLLKVGAIFYHPALTVLARHGFEKTGIDESYVMNSRLLSSMDRRMQRCRRGPGACRAASCWRPRASWPSRWSASSKSPPLASLSAASTAVRSPPRVLPYVPLGARVLPRQICFHRFPDVESMVALLAGVDIGTQIRKLRGGIDVAVGTPGRFIDLINRGNLDLGMVSACCPSYAPAFL
jgi:hypothetical protein